MAVSTPLGALTPSELRVNRARSPLGIDDPSCAFSWQLTGEGRTLVQSAYRVLVARGDHVGPKHADVWDSGWVTSRQQLDVAYAGIPLESRTRYSWMVMVTDGHGHEATSLADSFETAFLRSDEWRAQWIGSHDAKTTPIAPMLRRSFTVDRPVARARAYVTGLGYYELHLNGQKVGRSVLDPGWTDYRKRVLYSTYDVTAHLQEGPNVVGAMLGAGWFRSPEEAVPSQVVPQFILELHVELDDGSVVAVRTGEDGWLATTDGPLVENSIYGGETYDASREITGWDSEPILAIEGSHARWSRALVVEPPGGVLQSQPLEPIEVIAELAPVTITSPADGVTVLDFGQNIAGWMRIVIDAEEGDRIEMRFAELIDDKGFVNTINLRTARASDIYLAGAGGRAEYEPRFTYHGFRYVQIEGYSRTPDEHEVRACVVRSAVNSTGKFSCADPLVNSIHDIAVRTESNNLHSVPTDCPQRDERLAWLNDMTVRAEEAVHNFDLVQLYRKWIQDIADAQGVQTGAITDTAPFVRYGRRPADPVSSSYLVVPWLLYRHFGDTRTMERHYDGMVRWTEYLDRLAIDDIIEQSAIGDWAPPVSESVAGSIGAGAVSATTPGPLVSSAFQFLNKTLLTRIARVLGRDGDIAAFAADADRIRNAINERFLNRASGNYGPGNQASNALALYLDLPPADVRPAVLANLVADIEAHDFHVTTGNLCTKFMMDVLAREGRTDVAFRLLRQDTYPSWGYMVANGATTMWERWEHVTGGPLAAMASHDHPMYGAVDSWMYQVLAGIGVDDEGEGFGRIRFAPQFPDGLDWVTCELETVRGAVRSAWRIEGGVRVLEITVPPNAEGTLVLDAGVTEKLRVTEGGESVWADGVFSPAPGIAHGVLRDSKVHITVGSGDFSFAAEYGQESS